MPLENRVRTCMFCGKKLINDRVDRQRIFCSRECYFKERVKKVEKSCLVCNKKFYVSLYKSKKRKYCSLSCAVIGNTKKELIECKVCEKEFYIIPSRKKRSKSAGQYCSVECRNKSLDYIKNLTKANRLAWKEGRKKSTTKKGKDHHWWKGGIARLPYPWDFNEELKDLIRKRDNYKCQDCRAPQEEFTKKLDVHHIDHDKNNNDPKNLLTLCHSCHSKIVPLCKRRNYESTF